jgi:hypothetical protein
VGQNPQDVYLFLFVADPRDEAELVAADVENRDGISAGDLRQVGLTESTSDFRKAEPVRSPGEFEPIIQRGKGLRIFFGESINVVPLDNPHGSHYVILFRIGQEEQQKSDFQRLMPGPQIRGGGRVGIHVPT